MNIIGINASPRGSKSQTLRLVKAVLDVAKDSEAETELVDLCKLDIEYCNACGTCYQGSIHSTPIPSFSSMIAAYPRRISPTLMTLVEPIFASPRSS